MAPAQINRAEKVEEKVKVEGRVLDGDLTVRFGVSITYDLLAAKRTSNFFFVLEGERSIWSTGCYLSNSFKQASFTSFSPAAKTKMTDVDNRDFLHYLFMALQLERRLNSLRHKISFFYLLSPVPVLPLP